MQHTIILTGKIYPAVRMTQGSKWVDPKAIAYLASQADLKYQIKQQMAADEQDMLPAQTPLYIKIEIQVVGDLHTKDPDNQIKALMDAGNKIIYKDDRWVDHIEIDRCLGPADITVFTVGTLELA
jgi:Holliday junction resolvase RusA-like endonuclease